MKRRKVIKRIEDGGGRFVRHGAEHDIYQGPNGAYEQVPRHREIKDRLAEEIFKKLEV